MHRIDATEMVTEDCRIARRNNEFLVHRIDATSLRGVSAVAGLKCIAQMQRHESGELDSSLCSSGFAVHRTDATSTVPVVSTGETYNNGF